MKSQIFFTGEYKNLEKRIVELLNSQVGSLHDSINDSPRAVGAKVERLLAENFDKICGDLVPIDPSNLSRMSMEDFAFTDEDGNYYAVDVKTHRLNSKFNMPNLTSVERLTRFYKDDKNYFVVLKIDYEVQGTEITIDEVNFVPIEFLSWDCLTLGALGWGQIQIANAKNVSIIPKNSRKKWVIELCDSLFKFYHKEIKKAKDRISHFEHVRKQWENKEK